MPKPRLKTLQTLSRKLLTWYDAHARDLPWRRTDDPYLIWVSEVMLQQTTVKAVIPYFEKWRSVFPTVSALARADRQRVLKAWQGLGYYNRAKNMHESARRIVRDFGGRFPDKKEELRALPGFGPYTVGAVLSIAFQKPEVIIDANVRRVMTRVLTSSLKESAAAPDVTIHEHLLKCLPHKRPGDFNQALMEIGALICRSREPLCNMCPVKDMCRAYAAGIQELVPAAKSKPVKDVQASIAVIQHKGKFFLQQRSSKGLLADLWEFPGGKIQAGETARDALIREVREELGVAVTRSCFLTKVTHYYTQFRVNLSVWLCSVDPLPKTSKHHKWLKMSDIDNYPMPSGSARIVDVLRKK